MVSPELIGAGALTLVRLLQDHGWIVDVSVETMANRHGATGARVKLRLEHPEPKRSYQHEALGSKAAHQLFWTVINELIGGHFGGVDPETLKQWSQLVIEAGQSRQLWRQEDQP